MDTSSRLDGHDEPTAGPPAVLGGGRYEVGPLVGVGGTARVYRGYDRRFGRDVAIKIFRNDVVDIEQRRRLREISIHRSIDHPGVVSLLDTGSENGQTYLVMEFVEGENLAERLLAGPMTPGPATALTLVLADTLDHLHRIGVTHRDLKPGNILLGASVPLIADFGISHALGVTRITATGTVAGTAAYLAPEQVAGEPVGPPADIYALGLVLLECLTGELAYPGTMVEAAVARLSRSPWIPPDVPAAMASLIRRMTAREPASRPTAAEIREALVTSSPWPPATTERSGRRARRRVAAVAGSSLAVAALATSLLMVRAPEATPPPGLVPSPTTSAVAGTLPTARATLRVLPSASPPAGVGAPASTAPAPDFDSPGKPVAKQKPPDKSKKAKKPKAGHSS
ncbi:serine/threonine-protein kinase [Amycolatopsis sp. NBC_01480]|uniref:serine/threonine-protein kinase n=1 Tax=Amycolatopsis sp. NBC_01480 TaxID=2903562 RepID=UPI002E292638|nr:protein kinase [Amycolatopsis sp. NBC_01480]